MWGREKEDAPYSIQIFGLLESEKMKKLQKLREVKSSCQHKTPDLFGLVVHSRRLLAVTCSECNNITLIDLSNGRMSVAYRGGDNEGDFAPCDVCASEPGKLWVLRIQLMHRHVSSLKFDVIELACNKLIFTPTGRRFPIELKGCLTVCHIPGPQNALVISDASAGVVLCVHLVSGNKLWESQGKLDCANIDPWGIVFSPQHQQLLLADCDNKRILALDPISGSHLQSLPVPEELGYPWYLCPHNRYLFLVSSIRGEGGWSNMLSCFSLT